MRKNETKQDIIQKIIQNEEEEYSKSGAMDHLHSRIRSALEAQSKAYPPVPKRRWLIPVGACLCLAIAVTLYIMMPPSRRLDLPIQNIEGFLEKYTDIKIWTERYNVFPTENNQVDLTDEKSRLKNFILEAIINTSQSESSISRSPEIVPLIEKTSAAENLEKIKILIQEKTINDFLNKFTFFKEDNHDQKNISHSFIHWINNIQHTRV